MKSTSDNELNISKLVELRLEIVRFDKVLDEIQQHFPEDVLIWDNISVVRDSIHRLRQCLHGFPEIDNTSMQGDKDPWIDLRAEAA
jgi:hypothetical protein